jgi:putative FmdB family regulatory protein
VLVKLQELKLPLYDYECNDCGKQDEDFAMMADCDKPITCECGGQMDRFFSQAATSIAAKERFSTVMGVAPKQIEKAMGMYPGSEYTNDGRLIVKSRNDKMRKMAQRGFVEYE